jgi:hypothetical protein
MDVWIWKRRGCNSKYIFYLGTAFLDFGGVSTLGVYTFFDPGRVWFGLGLVYTTYLAFHTLDIKLTATHF